MSKTIKRTIDLPESTDKKVAGESVTIEWAKVSPEMVAMLCDYGLRKLGDLVNSKVNAAKKAAEKGEGTEMTPDEIAAERDSVVDALFDGTLFDSSRGTGMTDVEKVMHQLARTDWLATITDKEKKKAAAKLLMGEIRPHMAKIVESDPDGYRERAEKEIARRAELAKQKQENAKRAASAVESAGIDLDKLLK